MGENQGKNEIFTKAPQLPPEDLRLVDAYREFGVPVDQLITTGAIHQFSLEMKADGDTRSPEDLMKRLLNLRKAGRLPRFSMPSPSPSPRNTRKITAPNEKLKETIDGLTKQGVQSMTINFDSDDSFTLTYLPAAG